MTLQKRFAFKLNKRFETVILILTIIINILETIMSLIGKGYHVAERSLHHL